MTIEPLSAQQRATALAGLPDWACVDGMLERTFVCGSFDGSIAFVNALAALANAANHHPDVAIAWDRVTVRMTTHDAGGISHRDDDLAHALDALPR